MSQPSSDKSSEDQLHEQWMEIRNNSHLDDIVARVYESMEQDKRFQK